MKILTGHYVYTAPFNIFALFKRNFERLGVLINEHPNAPNSKPSRIDAVVAYIPEKRYRGLHPQEKVQGPTSLRKGTGAYIPRKCKGAYIPRKRFRGLHPQKRYRSQILGNVRGSTSPGKGTEAYVPKKGTGAKSLGNVRGPTSLGKGTQGSTSLGNEEAVNTWMYVDFSPVQAPFPCKSKI